MRRIWTLLAALAACAPAAARGQGAAPAPALRLELSGPPVPALADARPGCEAWDVPDAPARAIRLATGAVQLYATHFRNRVAEGPDLLHLRHRCSVVFAGGDNDDPAAFDDRGWIASPWTPDGRTVFAVVHDEFQGHRRRALCPSGRYMDCWYNALTLAVSSDGGHAFRRAPGRALIAALPYRYDQLGPGHHGYFNPTNIVERDGALFMMAFATEAGAQRPGNCLLRTTSVADAASWRAWDGDAFRVAFTDPYARAVPPEAHVCAPVGAGRLRWPVTSLVRHAPSGLFVALMLDAARGGGVFYATSPDLVAWSSPALLMPAVGEAAWTCADPPPLAYPSLLDPGSANRDFDAVGDAPVLFLTRFNPSACHLGADRELVRVGVRVAGDGAR